MADNKKTAGTGSGNEHSDASVDLRDQRREYYGEPLRRDAIASNPVEEFAAWMELAREHHPEDATAMVLATADATGQPSVRTVLLKHFDQQGFCWYSNSSSRKGQQLASNPQAALQFYWRRLNRQVRISGKVEQLTREAAEEYFRSRPVGSQISAAVSRQSSVVQDRHELVRASAALEKQFPDGDVPCPKDWCGYRLQPHRFEFWQGRENRLHDRLEFTLQSTDVKSGSNTAIWTIERLAP